MSLLLEALKKAEMAKEEAQRRAKEGDPGEAAALDPDATVVEGAKPITTRDQLPDISSPLEILSDDLRPAAKTPLELSIAEDPTAAPVREPRPQRPAPSQAPDAQAAGRATAQKVFEAKFREPNPRLPFYIVLGALGAFAVGTVTYFYIQLKPAPPLVNANPPRSGDEKPVDTAAAPATAATTPAAAPAAQAAITPANVPPAAAPTSAPANAAAPGASAAAVAPTAPAAAPGAGKPAESVSRAAAPSPPRARAAAPADEPPFSVNRGAPQVHPQVASGYVAYQAGDLQKARADYQQALRDEPANRDALLGLAAVEMRAQRYDAADGYYQRLLQIDPRDPHAQAGSVALRTQQLDPVQVESRVKTLIASDRDATVLYFTLGNQYAQQGRWPEAQQAYFKAFAADPENPDFAFNLAISLDQLRQPRLALEYYRRALALAEKRTAAFAPESARTRVQQLSAPSAR